MINQQRSGNVLLTGGYGFFVSFTFLPEKATMKVRIAMFAKFVCLKDRTMKMTQWAVCKTGPTYNTETVESNRLKKNPTTLGL